MFDLENLVLPIQEPMLVFTIILAVVLLSPLILKKSGIPDIIGLILAGVIIGPHGLNILSEEFGLNSVFGITGLLYLMFLAGLEINLREFSRNKKEGLVFGLLTFVLPFGMGFAYFYYFTHMGIYATLILSIMLASHTLISYPILGKLGITGQRISTVIISATIIADTIVLVALGVLSESLQEELNLVFWLQIIASFGIFFIFVFYLLPKMARWVFKNQEDDSSIQYIFVLLSIFVASTVAELLNIEPIIGAFFAGLSLNRLIVRTSPLMNRIIFIGNTLFIPFFMITVGMFVNIRMIIGSLDGVIFLTVLIVLALSGKYLAAWITQLIFRFSKDERHLMFGLSNARAASAIAVVVVGYNFDVISGMILNDTVLLILFSSMISSMVTQRSGRALAETVKREKAGEPASDERILVSISNPETIERLVEFSILIKDPDSEEPIYPISVVPDGDKAAEQNTANKKLLENALIHASASEDKARLITRIDLNVVDGLVRSIKELEINKIVLGWHGRSTPGDYLFGTILERLLKKTGKMILVARLDKPLALIENLHVILPVDAQYEKGFVAFLRTMAHMERHTNKKMFFYGSEAVINAVRAEVKRLNLKTAVSYNSTSLTNAFFEDLSKKASENDMMVFLKARKKTLSYSHMMSRYPRVINRYFNAQDSVIVYPEQSLFKQGIFDFSGYN